MIKRKTFLRIAGCALVFLCYLMFVHFESAPASRRKDGIKCFNGKAYFFCRRYGELQEACALETMQKAVQSCRELEQMGIYPYKKFGAYILEFDEKNEKGSVICNRRIKEVNRCGPFFKHYPSEDLPSIYVSRDDELRVMAHEMTHALQMEKDNTARLADEFFAVYADGRLQSQKEHLCGGAFHNQPALATFGGDYQDAKFWDPAPIHNISKCRYGQLRYFSSLLQKSYPDIFMKLWRRAEGERGLINVPLLVKWISEANPEAGELAKKFYVLRETDRRPHIWLIKEDFWDGGKKELIFTGSVLQNASSKKEVLIKKSCIRAYILRNGAVFSLARPISKKGMALWLPGEILPGDSVFMVFSDSGVEAVEYFDIP